MNGVFPLPPQESMEQTAVKNLLDDLERRVAALRGYL